MKSDRMPDDSISLDVVTPTDSEMEGEYTSTPISLRRRLLRLLWHVVARQLTLLCVLALVVTRLFGRRRRRLGPREGCEIMLTGRFESNNWILAFLSPLSASKECASLSLVSTNPVPPMPKVLAIYPPKWLMRVMGVTQARLLTFLWAAMRRRPHIVGGFHLIMNGIAAAIVGRLIGARSMYFCVGGPPEIQGDGGLHSDAHPWFAKMVTPDSVVEERLLRIVAGFDAVITMGSHAVNFLRDKGIVTDFHVVSGGIDPIRFQPTQENPSIDLISTGRLVPIKRIDVFLQAVRNVADKIPEIRAVIVGEGELRDELQTLSIDLGVDRYVSFTGYLDDDDVVTWLRRSKVFVLTSDSEGLSLSMIEAMMCGLPAVVSDVGDLGDLVEDGVNGYLVPRRSPDLFADRIIELLTDEQKLKAFSQAARYSTLRYTTEAATAKWDNIIEHYRTS